MMRKLAIALGVGGGAVCWRGCLEGRRGGLEVRHPAPSQCGQKLFTHRANRLLWVGASLPSRVPLEVPAVAGVLVQALLVG
jgi:hypothetical protein